MPPFDLDRLQTQDEKEWDAFFRFFETRLYHFARRYAELIIDETAQDIVQETLLTAYEEICRKKNPLKEGGRYLSTWVFGICKNRCRDYVKVQRARQQKNEELQEDDILTLHPSAPTSCTASRAWTIASNACRLENCAPWCLNAWAFTRTPPSKP
jgi:RNA polymerase sigma factor (sigma-70 family)